MLAGVTTTFSISTPIQFSTLEEREVKPDLQITVALLYATIAYLYRMQGLKNGLSRASLELACLQGRMELTQETRLLMV
jgi:hypothetical protein